MSGSLYVPCCVFSEERARLVVSLFSVVTCDCLLTKHFCLGIYYWNVQSVVFSVLKSVYEGFAKIAKYTTQILTRLKNSNTRQFAKYTTGFAKHTTTLQKLTLKRFDH